MRIFISSVLLIFILSLLGGYFPWLNDGQRVISVLMAAGLLSGLLGKRRR